MKVSTKIFYLSLLISILISCKDEQIDDRDKITERYFNLEKIGWKSREYSQKVDKIQYKAIEVPIQYYLLKNLGKENLEAVDQEYEERKSERIIEFTFDSDTDDNILLEKYTGMSMDNSLKYMAFGLDKDFYVVTSSKDTVRCEGVSYERSYQIAPYERVLLFFTGINPEEKIQLVYEDHLFRNGRLKFQFKDTYTKIAL